MSEFETGLSIQDIQGEAVFSDFVGKRVSVRGVVTGRSRLGAFLQDPEPDSERLGRASAAIFLAAENPQELRGIQPGMHIEACGTVINYTKGEYDRPCTQIVLSHWHRLNDIDVDLPVVWLDAEICNLDNARLAHWLNAHEFMVMGIRSGATFSQPSNPFGDYVVVMKGLSAPRSVLGSALIDPNNADRWLPSFRITRSDRAPVVDVGDLLLSNVTGPLNYRAHAFQIHCTDDVHIERKGYAQATRARKASTDMITILTLNAFNLDPHRERAEFVEDADTDIDDDVADGRFQMLADVVVGDAHSPDIIALQEIQDNDGAEITAVTDAEHTYRYLQDAITAAGGPRYLFAELAPGSGLDGGQPGGNIRNAYLYNPERVELQRDSLQRLGESAACFEGSRKALLARFKRKGADQCFTLINVHLASKRHQHSIFAPEQPGFDPREATRVEQAQLIRAELDQCAARGEAFYVTGDFNDFEFSPSVQALLGSDAVNLVETVEPAHRFDYNHRGKLHVLMHAITSKSVVDKGFQIDFIHGNEILGVEAGSRGTRATDHGYLQVGLRL